MSIITIASGYFLFRIRQKLRCQSLLTAILNQYLKALSRCNQYYEQMLKGDYSYSQVVLTECSKFSAELMAETEDSCLVIHLSALNEAFHQIALQLDRARRTYEGELNVKDMGYLNWVSSAISFLEGNYESIFPALECCVELLEGKNQSGELHKRLEKEREHYWKTYQTHQQIREEKEKKEKEEKITD